MKNEKNTFCYSETVVVEGNFKRTTEILFFDGAGIKTPLLRH